VLPVVALMRLILTLLRFAMVDQRDIDYAGQPVVVFLIEPSSIRVFAPYQFFHVSLSKGRLICVPSAFS
jgi:hypothetical protein